MPQRENDRATVHTLVIQAYCCICDELIETRRMRLLVSSQIPEVNPDTCEWSAISIRGKNDWVTETYRACPKHALQDLIAFIVTNKIKKQVK